MEESGGEGAVCCHGDAVTAGEGWTAGEATAGRLGRMETCMVMPPPAEPMCHHGGDSWTPWTHVSQSREYGIHRDQTPRSMVGNTVDTMVGERMDSSNCQDGRNQSESVRRRSVTSTLKSSRAQDIIHYIISKSDILQINCSSIALLDKCISQHTEPG